MLELQFPCIWPGKQAYNTPLVTRGSCKLCIDVYCTDLNWSKQPLILMSCPSTPRNQRARPHMTANDHYLNLADCILFSACQPLYTATALPKCKNVLFRYLISCHCRCLFIVSSDAP